MTLHPFRTAACAVLVHAAAAGSAVDAMKHMAVIEGAATMVAASVLHPVAAQPAPVGRRRP
jgi:hypothetical protein